MIKVSVKWGKENFDVEVDPSKGLPAFLEQLRALTNVPPERQKVLAKGKRLAEQADLEALKDGTKLMLMGSADAVLEAPKTAVVFEEDLTQEQKSELMVEALKAGLENAGNTCYLNSAVQLIRAVPDLPRVLKEQSSVPRGAAGAGDPLVSALGNLMSHMDRSAGSAVQPIEFLVHFWRRFPQFDQKDASGNRQQQDADEALSALLELMASVLRTPDGAPGPRNVVDALFGGAMECSLQCDESPGEAPTQTVEPFRKLRCHIQGDTSYLHAGLLAGLEEKMEKRSPSLGRSAVYTKRSAITVLPPNLMVQFMRFHWKQQQGVKAKVLRTVQFPERLDIQPYCATPLRKAIGYKRMQAMAAEDAKLGIKPQAGQAGAAGAAGAAGGAQVEATELTSAETIELAGKLTHSGYYELYAVITHQGRSADGGHYIGWTRQGSDSWQRFDDEKVTEVTTADILKLSGGGDWHMAYIVLYRLLSDADMAARAAETAEKKKAGKMSSSAMTDD